MDDVIAGGSRLIRGVAERRCGAGRGAREPTTRGAEGVMQILLPPRIVSQVLAGKTRLAHPACARDVLLQPGRPAGQFDLTNARDVDLG